MTDISDPAAPVAAVLFDPAGKSLAEGTVTVPAPEGFDLRVAVEAASVNPVDVKMQGRIPADAAPRPLGFDAAGRVTHAGPGALALGFSPGDMVWYAGAANRAGANARAQLVDARIAARAPEGMAPEDAAALPLTLLTAWEVLFDKLGFAEPPSEGPATAQDGGLLIINGAGGVGSIALQLARLAGIRATATASRKESRDWCQRMGAAEVIAHDALADLPDSSFRAILCCHDTDAYFPTMARLIAPMGMIASIVGAQAPLPMGALFMKSAGFVWEYMFARPVFALPDMARQGAILARATVLVEAGQIVSTRTATLEGLSLANVLGAHETLLAGRQIGKLALRY